MVRTFLLLLLCSNNIFCLEGEFVCDLNPGKETEQGLKIRLEAIDVKNRGGGRGGSIYKTFHTSVLTAFGTVVNCGNGGLMLVPLDSANRSLLMTTRDGLGTLYASFLRYYYPIIGSTFHDFNIIGLKHCVSRRFILVAANFSPGNTFERLFLIDAFNAAKVKEIPLKHNEKDDKSGYSYDCAVSSDGEKIAIVKFGAVYLTAKKENNWSALQVIKDLKEEDIAAIENQKNEQHLDEPKYPWQVRAIDFNKQSDCLAIRGWRGDKQSEGQDTIIVKIKN